MRAWSMSHRLVATLLILIVGFWMLGGAIAAVAIHHEVDEVFDSSLQETAQRLLPLVIDELAEHGGDERERRLASPFPTAEHEEHLLYQVRDASGRVLLRSHAAPQAPFGAPLRRGFFDDGYLRFYTEVSPHRDIFVQVAELPKDRREALQGAWLGMMIPLLVLLPIAAFAVYWTVRRATRPIADVQRQIARRSGENLDPIDPSGLPDELMPIIHDINRLLERLKSALDAERAFAANSAHELRTPIAAIRAQAEILAENLRGSPDRARVTQIVAMLGQLGRRAEKMLQLARTEAGLGLARIETDLVDVTRLVVDDYARRSTLAGRIAFDPGPDQPVMVDVDPDALGIALQNLIDNALAYGKADAPVAISVGPGPTVRVVNQGPVVSPEELATLTKPFERAGTRQAPGTGLGLAIVEQIMHQAGGRLELVSPAPGQEDGFEAKLSLPPSSQAPAA